MLRSATFPTAPVTWKEVTSASPSRLTPPLGSFADEPGGTLPAAAVPLAGWTVLAEAGAPAC